MYGGWGKPPIGFTPGESGMEFTYTDAQFNADIFTISTTAKNVTEDYGILEAGMYAVEDGGKITLPFEVDPKSTKINGMEYTTETTAAAGKFSVTVAEKASTIKFAASEFAVGDEVQIMYRRRVANADVTKVLTTTGSARGELVITYPVMSAGDDCTAATIKAYYHIHVYRVRVSARPSLDASRGSAASPTLTFTAMDAHRRDNKWYDLVYEELTPEGNVSTEYGDSVVYD